MVFDVPILMDGWMTCDLTSFSMVISGRWADDNERLCAVELCLRLAKSSP